VSDSDSDFDSDSGFGSDSDSAGAGESTADEPPRRIARLDEATVDRIAAGEVVTRPVDAVVELVENALDAGATSVEVAVERGGIDAIRVADDGDGMSRADAVLAVQRHTTSKIDSAADVDRVRTLGFRGEALPAIAAAGRLELTTRRRDGPVGTRVVVPDGPPDGADTGSGRAAEASPPEVRVDAAGRGSGTTVEVTDLFADLPPRRAALATPAREFRRVSEAVTRYALVRPGVRFRLEHDDRTVLTAPGSGDPVDAVLAAYDRTVAGHAHAVTDPDPPVDRDGGSGTGDVRVSGVAVAPAVTRASPAGVHLAVNGRALIDGNARLRAAVLAGYDRLLPGDRYPVVALDVSVPPGRVDVNVHPRKRELRFADPGTVADAVAAAVRRSFRGADVDLAREVDAEGAFEPARSRFEDAAVIGQYRGLYLLCEADDDLLVVDQHAAHERVNYERLRARLDDGDVESVPVDPPTTLSLSSPQRAALEANRDVVDALGFDVERFGGDTYRATGLPAPLGRADAGGDALVDVLDAFLAGESPADPRDALLVEAACHPSLRAGDDLTREAAADLLEALGGCEQPYACPHGRPTVLRVEESTLARGFERPGTRLD